MNTTSPASFCRTPSAKPSPVIRFAARIAQLAAVLSLVASLTGCAAGDLGTNVAKTAVPATTNELTTSSLVVHRTAIPKAHRSLPSPGTVDLFAVPASESKAKVVAQDADRTGRTTDTSPAGGGASTHAPHATGPTPPACPANEERVLLIGDSLSAGLGPHMAKRARACETKFFVHGVVGSHVTEWTQPSWLAAQLQRAQPTVVLVSLGGNDFIRNDPDRVQRAITRFVATVRASGARLLWISPPSMPFADKVGTRRMWQAALANDASAAWYPTEDLDIRRASDRVHPTIAEYDRLSGILWQWASTETSGANAEMDSAETQSLATVER